MIYCVKTKTRLQNYQNFHKYDSSVAETGTLTPSKSAFAIPFSSFNNRKWALVTNL